MNFLKIISTLISIIVYCYLGFFFSRENFWELIIAVSTLFIGLFYLYQKCSEKELYRIGLLFRITLLFSIPFLSQDFYRFIWDGNMIKLGYSPYQYLPVDFLNYKDSLDSQNNFQHAHLLYEKMGSLSQNHFSNYPPINQFVFFIGSLFSNNSIIPTLLFFKIVIVLADCGIVFWSKKILSHFNIPSKNIHLYFLNPLVIIELTGNCHFEGLMLFFLVLSFWFLIRDKWLWASIFIAISISTKLLPLLVLPLFIKHLKWKAIPFYASVIFFTVISFMPFLSSNMIENYQQTLSLWFVNFEFNASIYYIIRWVGFQIKGYNIIQEIGWILPLISMSFILYFSFFKNNSSIINITKNGLIVLTIYFLLSTTIHPWYVINLVLLGVLCNVKYPIFWSFTVFLSYYTYSNTNFQENFYLIAIEYIIILIAFIIERKKLQASNFQLPASSF